MRTDLVDFSFRSNNVSQQHFAAANIRFGGMFGGQVLHELQQFTSSVAFYGFGLLHL